MKQSILPAALVFALFSLTRGTDTDPSCNFVKFEDLYTYPVGGCTSTGTKSYKHVCIGDEVYRDHYDSQDCSGDVTSSDDETELTVSWRLTSYDCSLGGCGVYIGVVCEETGCDDDCIDCTDSSCTPYILEDCYSVDRGYVYAQATCTPGENGGLNLTDCENEDQTISWRSNDCETGTHHLVNCDGEIIWQLAGTAASSVMVSVVVAVVGVLM